MTNPDDNKVDLKEPEPDDAMSSGASGDADERDGGEGQSRALVTAPGETSSESTEVEEDEDDEEFAAPAQLGAQRFVYAAYFAGAVTVAFLLSKAISFAWARLSLWKPQLGEPDEMVSVVSAAIIGALVAFYYYRDEKVRTLAEEVASELGKVTWPTRDEVVNGTFVVVVTTFVATAFFALMDRFWGFVTNLVYGA